MIFGARSHGPDFLQSKPREIRVTLSAATQELVTLFAQLDDALNHQLDPLMEKFRETDATFYNEYQSARAIVDLTAARETQAEPVVTAAVSLPKAA